MRTWKWNWLLLQSLFMNKPCKILKDGLYPKVFSSKESKDFDTCYRSRTWVLPLLPYQAITHIRLEKDDIQLKLALNCIQEYKILKLWNQQYSPTTMELWSCCTIQQCGLGLWNYLTYCICNILLWLEETRHQDKPRWSIHQIAFPHWHKREEPDWNGAEIKNNIFSNIS